MFEVFIIFINVDKKNLRSEEKHGNIIQDSS